VIELLVLLVGIPAGLAAIYFGLRSWRWSLARMYLQGYSLGYRHGQDGFHVGPIDSDEAADTRSFVGGRR
jgi:hypothetical protein